MHHNCHFSSLLVHFFGTSWIGMDLHPLLDSFVLANKLQDFYHTHRHPLVHRLVVGQFPFLSLIFYNTSLPSSLTSQIQMVYSETLSHPVSHSNNLVRLRYVFLYVNLPLHKDILLFFSYTSSFPVYSFQIQNTGNLS